MMKQNKSLVRAYRMTETMGNKTTRKPMGSDVSECARGLNITLIPGVKTNGLILFLRNR